MNAKRGGGQLPKYVQHWECDCGAAYSGTVDQADEWCADHLNGHDSAVTMRGRMTSLSVATPPLVGGLLAHPGGEADVGPGGALAAGELDPGVEALRLGADGGDAEADLVEGFLLLPGGNGGDGGSAAEGFDCYVGEVHASTIDDEVSVRQPRMTAVSGSPLHSSCTGGADSCDESMRYVCTAHTAREQP